ncbi:MAG: putative exported protein [Candidatus Sulfotelmatobacter sp.]|nr:putative exported protein [Candidatus Sulfotelmatobacter sp.]
MQTNMKLEAFEARLAWIFASAIALLLLVAVLLIMVGFAGSSFAQSSQPSPQPSLQPKMFASAGDASNALFEAAQKQDEQALEAIVGKGKEVTSSSDEVEDKLEREQFSKKYQEMHRLVREPDGSTVLYIGAENWPFPIPLVSKNGEWYFDSKTGMDEIKYRRVGENESTAIQVCEEFAMTTTMTTKKTEGNAQARSDKADSEDPITRFAQSLVTGGTGSANSSGPLLFHGYYFRTLSGDSEAGKAKYVSDGKSRKRGAVALVAYPSDYRSSGVKTFIVTQKGIVFEKDLGAATTTEAQTIKTRSSGWRTAE